jgi:RNA polymerase sigma factor (sigma-70 family)
MDPIATQEISTAGCGAPAGGWDQFVARYDRPLAAAVRRALARVGEPARRELVEETVQEVYCRLLERHARRGGLWRASDRELVGYLGRVARSVVIDQLRNARAVKRGGERPRPVAVDAQDDPLDRVADPRATPEERLLGRERRRLFLDRCRRSAGSRALGRRDLRILELALLDGWSSREISRAIGGTLLPSSVDTLLHRLKRRLAAGGVHLPRR